MTLPIEVTPQDNDELFSVWQYFPDNSYERVRAFVGAKEAVEAAYHYTHNVAVMAGVTQRVIITDGGDCIVFEWLLGKGVVFPVPEEPKRDYGK